MESFLPEGKVPTGPKWKSLFRDGRRLVRCLLVTGCFLAVAACAISSTSGSGYTPIHLEKAGQSASQTIVVRRESGWLIYLGFRPQQKGLLTTDPRSIAFENLINDISGGHSSPLKPHRGLDLLLTISQKKDDGSTFVKKREEITEQPVHGSGNGAVWLYLYGLRLKPGEYIATVQSLQDDPRLDDANIELSVEKDGYAY